MRRETQGSAPCLQSVSRSVTALRVLALMAGFLLAVLALAAPAAQAEPKSVVGLFGGQGSGIFAFVQQVAVNPVTGDVYAVDGSNNRVRVFTDFADGQPDLTFGDVPPGNLSNPSSIGISPDGTRAYVSDNGGARRTSPPVPAATPSTPPGGSTWRAR